jgi:hypothetical protein
MREASRELTGSRELPQLRAGAEVWVHQLEAELVLLMLSALSLELASGLALSGAMPARQFEEAPAAELSANQPPVNQRWIALTSSDSSTIGLVM